MNSGPEEPGRRAEVPRLVDKDAKSQRGQGQLQAAIESYKESLISADKLLNEVNKHLEMADQLIADRRRGLKRKGYFITAVGVGAGFLLIGIDSRLHPGFWKEFLNALGTGSLTTGALGAAAAWVGTLLKPEDKESQTRILTSLKILIRTTNKILTGLSRAEVEYRSQIAANEDDFENDPRTKLSWFT